MTTTMAHQESIHERLQRPNEPYLHHESSWPSENQEDQDEPYYNMPKRNKRKNFKPRCAPNLNVTELDEERTQLAENGSDDSRNFDRVSAVDLSRRVSTDSNENESISSPAKYQQSLADSFDGAKSPINFSSSKNPFAISQLIKTNSPPRRRESEGSDDDERNEIDEGNERDNGDDRSHANESDVQQNGDTNKLLRDYAMNTMKELLGIYGLSSNEVSDAITSQMRALEAMQAGKTGFPIPLSLKRRHDSNDSVRRSSSATEDDSNNTPPKTPEDIEDHRQKAMQFLSQQSLRLLGRNYPSSRPEDDEVSGSEDGDQTLDLSVSTSKDVDGQDLSTTSSTNNSVTEFEQQTLLMRKNLEDLANLQMQGLFQKPSSMMDLEDSNELRKLAPSGLLSALNQLDQARKIAGQTNIDYSRYVKRYGSALECGSTYCKDLGYREHFHCMDCTARVFCKKEEMIRHFKWHKKRDESLAHGFMRYSPLDDCSERYGECPHNRSQTHYHCIQDGCDKVYISTSDVQMHANYHRKDSAILQEGFQRFRATENCSTGHCIFRGQRTTHFHCRRPGCTYTFKNKADMEKHKTYHIKDEQLARDGFKKYLKSEGCPYPGCRLSRVCNHIHCTRRSCSYVLHSSSQLYTHKRKHERQDRETLSSFPLQGSLVQNALTSPTNSYYGEADDPTSLTSLEMENYTLAGFNQSTIEEVFRKYVETYPGGRDPDDKCSRCSAFNKHFHCLAEGCKMVHSCQNTTVKHALEHENQSQVTEAYYITYSRNNPCSDTACQHIKDITHYHCNWENCNVVIMTSEEQPFKRLEHYRQHAHMKPISPNLAARLAPNLASQLGHPGPLPNLANLAQMAPNLVGHPNLQAQLGLTPSTMGLPSHSMQHMSPSNSLDEMFSRKRGRPPKNRVVEVWTDNVTPQAIFTSFKLPKSNHSPILPPAQPLQITEEYSRIKFQNFEVYTSPEACSAPHPSCQLKTSKQHLHCSQCNFASESHSTMETHASETHNTVPLLEGFDFFVNCDHCNQPNCFKNQLRNHFHCTQLLNCNAILTQYSTVATHKHVKEEDEVRDYSTKDKDITEIKSEAPEAKDDGFEKDADGAINVSVVKATGTFYPSSHLKCSPSPKPEDSSRDATRKSPASFPPACVDQNCSLTKKGQHYHCMHCKEPYGDLKNLYAHMIKRHSSAIDNASAGLAATKETLEREYPEISILPSTASVTSPIAATPPADQVQAVQNLLLQQYLSATSLHQAQSQQKKPSTSSNLQEYQQQYAMMSGLTPAHLAQMAFLSQSSSPFPLYHSMLYPPEMLLEQGLISGIQPYPMEKDIELMKKPHAVRGPHMRLMKDEPIPEGYLRFRFNEDCAYPQCGYREHQTHFHCTRKDCGYSFCDKTRFVQHTARHERLDTLMGGDFQQFRANVYCNRSDCVHASNFGSSQNKASHFHCLKCEFVCTDTNKVVAHRRQHQKMDSIQAAGFDKFPPSKGCGFEPQCIHSKKQTHYHCLQCGFAVLGLSQMTSHKYKHQESNQGPSTSTNS